MAGKRSHTPLTGVPGWQSRHLARSSEPLYNHTAPLHAAADPLGEFRGSQSGSRSQKRVVDQFAALQDEPWRDSSSEPTLDPRDNFGGMSVTQNVLRTPLRNPRLKKRDS
jgi:hypothetical protein